MDTNEAIAKVRAAWSADPEVFVTTSDEARRFVVALATLGVPIRSENDESFADTSDRVREAMASHAKARDDEYGS